MDYLDWNDQLAARFFTPESRDSRVYLFVTNDVIREVGRPAKVAVADFVAAVKRGPNWVSGGNICARAEQCLEGWRKRKLPYPPYVGYLSFFVLAAGIRGDFAKHAYYPRLRQLLGEAPTAGTYPGFSKMRHLWDDLENWTQVDRR